MATQVGSLGRTHGGWPRSVRVGWALAAFLSAMVALVSFRYLLHLGAAPDNVAANAFVVPWLVVHATGAAVALLVGPLQFLAPIRLRRPAIHRWTGRLYVAGCGVGGVAGLVLAAGASTGWVSSAGFGLLAAALLVTTARGWRLARNARYREHREWMIRSFALLFGAVTLRIYLPLAMALPGVAFEDAYRAIAFISWVPNVLVAELIVRGTRPRRASRARAPGEPRPRPRRA
jgi:hypothetical protein